MSFSAFWMQSLIHVLSRWTPVLSVILTHKHYLVPVRLGDYWWASMPSILLGLFYFQNFLHFKSLYTFTLPTAKFILTFQMIKY